MPYTFITAAKLNICIFVYIQIKCHQYWPSKGSNVYGDTKVTLHKEEQLANYCFRHFFVEQVSCCQISSFLFVVLLL